MFAAQTKNAESWERKGGKRSPERVHPCALPMPVIQRTSCACGGGCPRCEKASDDLKVQTKLAISTPGDEFEQEADEVADQVMRMPDHMGQRRPSNGEEPRIQRQTNGEGGTGEVASDFTSRLGAGVPLDTASRSYFEPRFGHDFGNVRVHHGPQATTAAASIQARAFTLGRDVVFGAGEHDPQSDRGKRLLAHELTHVVQQRAGVPSVQLKPLTEEEKKENLKSPRFSGSERLQKSFDNDPVMRKGEADKEAVKILQQALIDALCTPEISATANCAKAIMPLSTNDGTESPDGIFGDETFITVQKFQMKHGLLDENGRADGRPGRNTLRKLDDLFPAPTPKPAVPKLPLPTPPVPTPAGKLSIEIKPVIAPGSTWDSDAAQLAELAPRIAFAKTTWKRAGIDIQDKTPTKDSAVPKGLKAEDQAALAGKLGGTNRLIIVMLTDQCCKEVEIFPFISQTTCPDAITRQGPPPSVCMSTKNLSFDSVLGHELGHVFFMSGDHSDGLMQIDGPYPDTLSSAQILQAQAFFLIP